MANAELSWSQFLSMGAATAAVLVVGVGLGWFVDHLLGTLPIFLFVGLLLGVVGAVTFIVRTVRTYLN
ncbi:MAG: AtpZ/AtpI family protein [Actinomycetota bacterium]|nr:AtpZ/AtpI family protein [Actinomycetota bacterium]